MPYQLSERLQQMGRGFLDRAVGDLEPPDASNPKIPAATANALVAIAYFLDAALDELRTRG